MNEKKLLIFILELLEEIDITSKKTFDFLNQFITELSFSFGFKPLDDLESIILKKLHIIYQTEEFEYLKYEQFMSFKDISKKIDTFDFLDQDRTFEIFNLIIEIFELLDKESKKTGKSFSKLIEYEDISPNILFDFQPIYKLMDNMIVKFDKKIIGKINNVDSKWYDDSFGIMYNFLEKKYSVNKYITVENINIYTIEDLFNLLNKFYKNTNDI